MNSSKLGIVGCVGFGLALAQRATCIADVVLFDDDDDRLATAESRRDELRGIHLTGAIADLHDRRLVIDARGESIESSQRMAARLGATCERRTELASIVEDAPAARIGVASGRPGRWVGLHPVELRAGPPLVEVVRTAASTPATIAAWRTLLGSLGLRTVLARDVPGFLVRRILYPSLAASLELVERGDAEAHELAAALQLGAGWEENPFDLLAAAGPQAVRDAVARWSLGSAPSTRSLSVNPV